jgi:hypothetical protein
MLYLMAIKERKIHKLKRCLEIRLYDFILFLLFMRLSRSYDLRHRFCELTRLDSSHFIVFFFIRMIFFSISSFNNEFIENELHNLF